MVKSKGISGGLCEFLLEQKNYRKKELESLKDKGGVIVGYFCNYTPVEIIEACGAVPVDNV